MKRLFWLLLVSLANLAFAQPRVDSLINSGWKFSLSDYPNAERVAFRDSGWQDVTLPHTWNALDGQDGGNNYHRGVGWYWKDLPLGPEFRGKSIFLKFDAASTVAHVFVNGTLAGTHKGGFSAFCLDITSLVSFDSANVIVVKVSNAPDSSVAPLRGDFTLFGGLYRGVHLLALSKLSVSPLDHGSSGVYAKQSNVSNETAELEITVMIRNASSDEKAATVRTTVLDQQDNVVVSSQTHRTVAPGSHSRERHNVVVRNPRLWQGRVDPYMYRVRVEVLDGSVVVDRVDEYFGIRSFAVDPDKGFFLNGKSYRLAGVNRHQDRENMGWAIGLKEHKEDYRLIEEMGCTAVRLAHYQQAKEFYDLCDRGGIVVVAELSLVDFIHPGKEFEECTHEQLTELIKQNFNHPSVIFWSLFNELIPDKHKEAYAMLVDGLNALARDLDPARLTAMASRSMFDGSEYINTVTDVAGYNVYKGWYEDMPEDFAGYADTLHARFPRHRIGITEYGAGAGTSQHEVPPRKPRTTARWHPEEWQSVYHEAHWKAMAERPFLWGTFVWNMFDFASDSRLEGELPGRNDKGLVTYDRKIKKDAYFWYKSNWNPEPMVYITSRRFTPRPAGSTEIKVYSNCDSVALSVNGKKLGTKSSNDKRFVWDAVELLSGMNIIKTAGVKDGVSVQDSCVWQAN